MKADLRWSIGAVMALHCASEDYCITLFELSNLAAIHVKQVTLMPKDIRLVQTIRGEKSMLDRPMEVKPKPLRLSKPKKTMVESKLKVKSTSKQKTKTGEMNQKVTSTESEEDEELGVREKSDAQKKDKKRKKDEKTDDENGDDDLKVK